MLSGEAQWLEEILSGSKYDLQQAFAIQIETSE